MLIVTEHDGSRWVDYDDARAAITKLVTTLAISLGTELPEHALSTMVDKIMTGDAAPIETEKEGE